MTDVINEYFDLHNKVLDFFGYQEGWVVLPLEDRRKYYWEMGRECVRFANLSEELEDENDGNCYADEIYRGRHILAPVCRTENYTLIAVDTHTDGNKFLAIFDNSKERC